MPVRSSMAALITRTRLLTNDPAGGSQIFADQDYQDVLDESREDVKNLALIAKPTFINSQVSYLDYYSRLKNWEDDYTLKQYLITDVTNTTSLNEPIAGHWLFGASTFPPVYISGKVYDVYRAAADLLERWAAKLTLSFDFTTDGQSFRRSQMHGQLLDMALHYRMKQRARSISMSRNDLNVVQATNIMSPGPHDIDYMVSGDK